MFPEWLYRRVRTMLALSNPLVDTPFCSTRVALQEDMENAGFDTPSRRCALLWHQIGSARGCGKCLIRAPLQVDALSHRPTLS